MSGCVGHPYSRLPGRRAVAYSESAVCKLAGSWKLGVLDYSWYFKPALLPPWYVLEEPVSPSCVSVIICEMVSFFPEDER